MRSRCHCSNFSRSLWFCDSFSQLAGKRIGVQRGATADRFASAVLAKAGAEVVRYTSQDEIYLDLVAGRLDATFAEREESRRQELGSWLERIRTEDQQSLLELANLVDTSLRETRLENHQSREAIVELARVLLPEETTFPDSEH